MTIGYTELQIAHMYYWKWCGLFDQFKKQHNMVVKGMYFK